LEETAIFLFTTSASGKSMIFSGEKILSPTKRGAKREKTTLSFNRRSGGRDVSSIFGVLHSINGWGGVKERLLLPREAASASADCPAREEKEGNTGRETAPLTEEGEGKEKRGISH